MFRDSVKFLFLLRKFPDNPPPPIIHSIIYIKNVISTKQVQKPMNQRTFIETLFFYLLSFGFVTVVTFAHCHLRKNDGNSDHFTDNQNHVIIWIYVKNPLLRSSVMVTITSIYMDKDINVKIIISYFFSQIELTFFFYFLAFLGRRR